MAVYCLTGLEVLGQDCFGSSTLHFHNYNTKAGWKSGDPFSRNCGLNILCSH